MPLFFGLKGMLTWLAWDTQSGLLKWSAYLALGYLWMSIVTLMHDATHNALFAKPWKNWAFGILTMIPLMASFVSFKEDHLAHHRYNRSPRDPDAFTMGKRGALDFVAFYGYIVAGALLSFVHFNFIYPVKHFNARKWAIHIAESVLKIACYVALLVWAHRHGVLGKTLEVWLVPIYIFSLFNSVRFIAEHYETPWNRGQLVGSRTVTSNPVHSFFWNNINWHIGHHIYPTVPWYNLIELHRLMEPSIRAEGAIVEKSYTGVFLRALARGPESPSRLSHFLEARGLAGA
jgi:fatty acid desaturase